LLPVGAAWEWSVGGFGDNLLLATAEELARVDEATQSALDAAIELHRPAKSSYTLADYQRISDEATHIIPRKPTTIGSHIGYRLWSHTAPTSISYNASVLLSHLIQPLVIGSHIGYSAWSARCRYYLHIQLDKSLINTALLYSALRAFKQAHVYLYVEDVADMEYVNTYDDPDLYWDDDNLTWS
jgi:hypothetical protein